MEVLNLTKNESPQVFLKKFCLDTYYWLLNLKIFRRITYFQSTSLQLKAAKKLNKIKVKKHKAKTAATNTTTA